MRTLRLSRDGFEVLEQNEYIEKRIYERLRFPRGEWFLDVREGIPYFSVLLGKRAEPALVAQEIAYEIRQIDGVIGVEVKEVDLDTQLNRLEVTIDVETEYGTMNIGRVAI